MENAIFPATSAAIAGVFLALVGALCIFKPESMQAWFQKRHNSTQNPRNHCKLALTWRRPHSQNWAGFPSKIARYPPTISKHDATYRYYSDGSIRIGLPRRFSGLAVFDARFYIRVRRINEPSQLCGVGGCSRSQLHMAHDLAGALQQARRIPQRCALKESHIYV